MRRGGSGLVETRRDGRGMMGGTTDRMYVPVITMKTDSSRTGNSPVLPCACANLRRAARAGSRLYNRELRETGLEITQFTILMTLEISGEITQGELGRLLSLDSTTLSRILTPLVTDGWVGED